LTGHLQSPAHTPTGLELERNVDEDELRGDLGGQLQIGFAGDLRRVARP
jgi:hypothetical protein